MSSIVQPDPDSNTPQQAERENDTIADTVLALADDFLAHYTDGDYVDLDDAYSWLIAQAANIRGHQ